jgi:hypothetical protein
MSKRKGILEFMKRCLRNPDYDKEIANDTKTIKSMKELILTLHGHYGFVDIEKRQHNHQLSFFLLYINDDDLTFEEIAEKIFVGMNGLKKRIRSYNKTALDFITAESMEKTEYIFLLERYKRSGI